MNDVYKTNGRQISVGAAKPNINPTSYLQALGAISNARASPLPLLPASFAPCCLDGGSPIGAVAHVLARVGGVGGSRTTRLTRLTQSKNSNACSGRCALRLHGGKGPGQKHARATMHRMQAGARRGATHFSPPSNHAVPSYWYRSYARR